MISSLSPREEDVCRELLKGRSNQQIATSLGLKLQTVKKYLSRSCWRFGISTLEGIPRVRLAAALLYAQCPELVPFRFGDRAQTIGQLSAHDCISKKPE